MSKTAQPGGYIPRDRSRHRKESDLAPLDPNFGGCGWVITGDDGSYEFRTVQPGRYLWRNGMND
jgi:protocatechuate 3,4-dioxygenase beta subunit